MVLKFKSCKRLQKKSLKKKFFFAKMHSQDVGIIFNNLLEFLNKKNSSEIYLMGIECGMQKWQRQEKIFLLHWSSLESKKKFIKKFAFNLYAQN